MLLELSEIQRRTNEITLDTPPDIDLSDGCMEDGIATNQDIAACEKAIGVTFPDAMKYVIKEYDLSSVALGITSFSSMNHGYLERLVIENTGLPDPPFDPAWWTGNAWVGGDFSRKPRPEDLIMIAHSEGYIDLCNVQTGEIFAFDRYEDWTRRELVARDFELFVRGVGTAWLKGFHEFGEDYKRREELARQIADAVGSKETIGFWKYLA